MYAYFYLEFEPNSLMTKPPDTKVQTPRTYAIITKRIGICSYTGCHRYKVACLIWLVKYQWAAPSLFLPTVLRLFRPSSSSLSPLTPSSSSSLIKPSSSNSWASLTGIVPFTRGPNRPFATSL